ncbi:MAG: D-aminoacyl-tRNA deacylase [Ilumatobacter sp.]
MRAVVQRVTSASVTSRSGPTEPFTVVGTIGAGLLVLVGVTHDDAQASADKLASKLAGLRVFDDAGGAMNLGARDVGASFLVVSQFTLYGDTSKGRRPSWVAAARPDQAEPLVERVVERLRDDGFSVETGRFRTEMQVSLVNDGPITLVVET